MLITPKPDKVYRLEANLDLLVVRLVEAADQTVLIRCWDETIKAGALARLFAGIKQYEDAKFWQGIYRFGFNGSEGKVSGGLELLQKITDDQQTAPLIADNNNL